MGPGSEPRRLGPGVVGLRRLQGSLIEPARTAACVNALR
jgi:hypothetical protein